MKSSNRYLNRQGCQGTLVLDGCIKDLSSKSSLMLKRDTETGTGTQHMWFCRWGHRLCSSQKWLNWATAVWAFCISKLSHKREVALYALQRSPRIWWAFGSRTLMVCPCYRQPGKSIAQDQLLSWPHWALLCSLASPSKSCSLSSSESNPRAFTELPTFISGLASLKGNSDLTSACGCLESLFSDLLHRSKELSFAFLWTAVACWLPLSCSWWIHKALPHQTQLFLVHPGSLFLPAPFTAKGLLAPQYIRNWAEVPFPSASSGDIRILEVKALQEIITKRFVLCSSRRLLSAILRY